jgi:hypothetical protein
LDRDASEDTIKGSISEYAERQHCDAPGSQSCRPSIQHLQLRSQDYHHDERIPSYVLPTSDQPRDDSSDFASSALHTQHRDTNSISEPPCFVRSPVNPGRGHCHGMDKERTGKLVSDPSRQTITSLLNNSSTTLASTFATKQDSPLQGSGDGRREPDTAVIKIDKSTLHRLLERPSDIIGGIFFGSPSGLPPFLSLRLPKTLNSIVRQSGEKVIIKTSPGASRIKGVYLIRSEVFCELIKQDGFGAIYWNETGQAGHVSIEVPNEKLIADFIRVGVPPEVVEQDSSETDGV